MPTVIQSPSTDNRSAAKIARFRTTPDPGAWTRTETYSVDTADGETIQVNQAEWRRLLEQVRGLADRRMVHRHAGIDLECNGVLIEVVQ
jgi:hypothetical protein